MRNVLKKLKDQTVEATSKPLEKSWWGNIQYRFAYPEIEKSLKLTGANEKGFTKNITCRNWNA